MTKPMSEFTTDLQHSGMPAKDLDETIEFYTKKLGFELAGLFHNGENRCAFLRQSMGVSSSPPCRRVRPRDGTRTEFQRH